jgi:diketogulonate reductase-like aldo/keto reductase
MGSHSVPQLGQGTWNMGESDARRKDEIAALRCGIELGMTVIDTAEMYGSGRSESLVGEAIAGLREQVYLVSKVLPSNASAKGVVRAGEASLKRLRTDTLDLYLLHWRGQQPLSEALAGFTQLQQQGKIRDWGVSNFDVDDMEELYELPEGKSCATNQVLYNPEYRGIEFDLLPWCEQHDLHATAYSPVGQGGDLLNGEVLASIAKKHDATPAQIALAWCLRKPVLAIPKAGSVKHVEENAAAAAIRLTHDDLDAIDQAYPPPRKKQQLATL